MPNNQSAGKSKAKKYHEVVLGGERSAHLEKKVNELGSWEFFRYLYGNFSWKLVVVNMILLVFVLPCIILLLNFTTLTSVNFAANLPTDETFLAGGTYWFGIKDYTASLTSGNMQNSALWTAILIIFSTLALSGGFSVVRDSFWGGELKIFRPFFRGIKETTLTMLPFMIILAGLFYAFTYILSVILPLVPTFVYIIVAVTLYGLLVLLAIYVMIVFSTYGAYKQDLRTTLLDSWELYKASFVANLFSFVLAFAPIVYLLASGLNSSGFLNSLLIVMFCLLGFFYTVFVWEVHMMKTYRLYHPVEKKIVKKKG